MGDWNISQLNIVYNLLAEYYHGEEFVFPMIKKPSCSYNHMRDWFEYSTNNATGAKNYSYSMSKGQCIGWLDSWEAYLNV